MLPDPHLSHLYGLALPLLKRGMPVTPVQLENLDAARYLDGFRVLLLSYHGMKPLSPDAHRPLTEWVKRGGVLVVVDDDTDPYNRVREWWNSDGRSYATPREHLFDRDAAILSPASRLFLLDLAADRGREPRRLASACKALPTKRGADELSLTVEGVGNSPAVILMHAPERPSEIKLRGQALKDFEYSIADQLLWIRFANEAAPREVSVRF
ncbi:MAG: hypothetical protein DME26_12860 [Verrucomicrobia bacterium]|nr:MAG: hypothetical protein DME26_12860 [Verrucomicrobiota bacterium]